MIAPTATPTARVRSALRQRPDHARSGAPRLSLVCADPAGLRWAQHMVIRHHYLGCPVDRRCRPFAYLVTFDDTRVGCLIFGRPEATRCYAGALTYGSQAAVAAGRAQYDRWAVLNLARVWLDRTVQQGGCWYDPAFLPGFTDRRGVWRSTLATTVIGMALQHIGTDYLIAHPPCFLNEPYRIHVVLSYCDTRRHSGTIYRAAGWQLARTNARGLQTWYTTRVAPLTPDQDAAIRTLAQQCARSRRVRSQRAVQATQV